MVAAESVGDVRCNAGEHRFVVAGVESLEVLSGKIADDGVIHGKTARGQWPNACHHLAAGKESNTKRSRGGGLGE